MRLLVTRPEPDAARTAQALRALGHEVLVAPLMRVSPVSVAFPGPWAGLLMTSPNAARVIPGHREAARLKHLPVFTVGDRTAEAAREAGFRNVTSAGGALPDLVRLVAARFAGSGARLLYLAGRDRAGNAGEDLAAHGIDVQTVVVYRAETAPELPAEAVAALAEGRLDGALHYSRRSAETLRRLAEAARVLNAVLSLEHYCLSSDVAVPLRGGHARIKIAPVPQEAALLELIGPA